MSLPTRVLLCCLACAAGVFVLSSGSATAKPRKPAKRRHHARQHSPRHRNHYGSGITTYAGTQLGPAEPSASEQSVDVATGSSVWLGARGGGSPRSGFDCSGLTRWVYGHVGVSLPHYSVAQWSYGRRVARRALVPGDLPSSRASAT